VADLDGDGYPEVLAGIDNRIERIPGFITVISAADGHVVSRMVRDNDRVVVVNAPTRGAH
jgi:hypothetical protein